MSYRRRRAFLQLITVAGVAKIAGCASNGDQQSDDEDGNGEEEETDPEISDDVDPEQEQVEGDEEEELVNRPDNYRIDFYPEENDNLRGRLDNPRPIDESHSIYTNHNTEREEDEHGLDLPALRAYHENNWDQLNRSETGLAEVQEALTDPDAHTDVKENPVTILYPNGVIGSDVGYWDQELFETTNDMGEAYEWAHRLVWNMDGKLDVEGEIERGPFSIRDEIYAASIEKAINEHNENIDAYAWAFKVDGGSHGNGLVHLENNNTGEKELRILETTVGYHTVEAGGDGSQYTASVEDSNFFNPNADEITGGGRDPYNIHHPLRFHTDRQGVGAGNFHNAKRRATALLAGVGGRGSDVSPITNVAVTNSFLKGVTQDLREYNQRNDVEFDRIVESGNVYRHFAGKDGHYVIDGTYESPEVFSVENQNIVDQVWEDENGDYNNFEQTHEALE